MIKRAVDKTRASEFVGVVLSRIAVGIIGFIGFCFALQSLGVPLGPPVGALGIAGLALAFAFQDILENVNTATTWIVRDAVARRVKTAFDQAGVEIPFPQRVVHIPDGANLD